MEDDYLQSLKRCILDYVLMDKKEPERLGLTMKKQVCGIPSVLDSHCSQSANILEISCHH